MYNTFYFSLFQVLIFCYLHEHVDSLTGVNVRKAGVNEFPSVVSLTYADATSPGNHICTGVLIARDLVLTSAHCIEDVDVLKMQACVGSNNLNECGKIDIRSWISYSTWDGNTSPKYYDDDLAILHLVEKVCEEKGTPANMTELQSSQLVNINASVAGWGVSNTGDIPLDMETANLKIYLHFACTNMIRQLTRSKTIIPPSYICTTSDPRTLLQFGDSGGPIFDENQNIIGINAFTIPPDDNVAINLHMNVHYYKDFIADIILSAKRLTGESDETRN